MALTTQQRIRLQELLLQREALYARVHAIESEVHRIFGAEYPLPPPPVEVATPGAKKKSKKKPRKQDPPPKVRSLQDGETAYRVRFREESGAGEETHTDRKAIETLLQSPLADTLIETVETIGPDGEARERLFP